MALIFTPGGGAIDTDRKTTHLPMEFMQMIAVFADSAGHINWGLHCSQCKQNIVGRNARESNQWRMDCGCRIYVGANAIPKPAA